MYVNIVFYKYSCTIQTPPFSLVFYNFPFMVPLLCIFFAGFSSFASLEKARYQAERGLFWISAPLNTLPAKHCYYCIEMEFIGRKYGEYQTNKIISCTLFFVCDQKINADLFAALEEKETKEDKRERKAEKEADKKYKEEQKKKEQYVLFIMHRKY